MSRLKFYKRLSLVSCLVLVLLNHFAFGFLAFLVPFAKADTITWIGPSSGYWEEPTNWSGGEIPTALDNVVIDLETNGPVYATSTINFASLTLLNMNKDSGGSFVLQGTIGSGGDITLSSLDGEPGNFSFTGPQTISGTLTVEAGAGLVAWYMSTSTPITPISFTAQNIDIQADAYVTLSSLYSGFLGGASSSTGQGPGGGVFGDGPNGSGGAHAGNGGMDAQGDLGGEGYCNLEDPETLGSGGAGGGPGGNNGANGGVFFGLFANDELIVNGQIEASGGDSSAESNGGSDAGGGGAGGAITLSADIISGTPQLFTVAGGNSIGDTDQETSGEGGGGGGGCVKISYGTSNSITPDEILTHGGYGYQRGGAGSVFIQKQDDTVRQLFLSSLSNSSSTIALAAETPQTENELSLQTLSLTTSSIYTIGSGKTLILTSSTPFSGSSSGTIKIVDGGTLKIDSDAIIENVTIELHEGGEILDSATDLSTTLNFSVGQGAVFDMRGFTTDTPFIVETFTVDTGGVVTHGSHEGLLGTFTHMVNIQAEEIEIASGSSINVSGKGFAGGVDGEDGNGPGGGEFVDMFTAVGAGHGGAGNASDTAGDPAGPGGPAYCDVSNPSTLGSGGASGFHYEGSSVDGGNGGGLVWLVASSSLVLEGDILADGTDGDYAHFISEFVEFLSNAGAGAGGGVKLRAPTIEGNGEVFVRGGNNGVDPSPEPTEYGGGGGGCVLVNYVQSNQVVTSSVYVAGGGLDAGIAEDGLLNIIEDNEMPELSLNIEKPEFVQTLTDSVSLDGATDFAISGDYAYVVAYEGDTFAVIDISSSTNPVIVGEIESTPDLHGAATIEISGDYAFVGSIFDNNSLRVIDISSSTNPVIVGGIEFEGEEVDDAIFMDIALSGNYLYLTTLFEESLYPNSLQVIDISNPLSPEIVSSITSEDDSGFYPAAIAIAGQYAYVSSLGEDFNEGEPGSIKVIDISNTSLPVIVGTTNALDFVFDIAVSGDYVYAPGYDSGMVAVIDISDKQHPELVHEVRGFGGLFDDVRGISVSGDYAYITHETDGGGIVVMDIRDPLHASFVGVTSDTALDRPFGLKIVGQYAYVTDQTTDSFSVFDISRTASVNPTVGFYARDNDGETLSVKAEYVSGACATYSGGTYPTFSAIATSTYGVSIDNAAGDNRRVKDIIIDSEAVDPGTFVTTTWLASTDVPETEGEYCMFMTPYDGEDEGTRVSGTLTVDDPLLAPDTPSLSAQKTQTSITLSWDVVGGVEYYTVSSTISEIPTETTETSVTYAGLSSDTEYVFQIKATDNFDNSSAYSNTFTVETERPSTGGGGASLPPPPPDTTPSSTPTSTVSNPSGLIVINNGAYYTKSREVTVSLDSEFTSAYILADILDFSGKIYKPIVSSTTYTLTPGDGEKRIYARFSSNYGIYDAYDVIVLDTIPPLQPTINTISSPDLVLKTDGVYGRKNVSSTARIKPTLGGTAEPGKRIIITATYGGTNIVMMVLAAVETYYTTADSNGNWSFTFPNELQNTYYTVSVQVQDEAENASAAVETEFDLRSAGTSPCTTNCEPLEELPPEEPPEELPPIEEPPEELPPIEETSEEIPSCTTDCGGEETPPVDTGGDGMGTDEETTADSTSTGDTEGDAESSSTESVSDQVISSITDSVSIISDTIETFFTEVGDSLREIPVVRGIVETASVAVEKTREVIDNPTVEKTNEVIAAPIIAVAAAANVAVGGAGLLSQAVLYLRLIFSQPLLLLKLRKRKSWGVVFNAYTKLPLDLATVRLVNGKNDSIMRTQVTDTKGRYFMVAENGVYRLEAQKDGFGNKITITAEDSVYPNVYRGEKLELADESNNLNYNIPLEPIVEEKTNTHVLREYARKAAHKTVSLIGVVATIVSLIISPNSWITALLVFHVALYGLMRRLAHKKIKGTFGSVTDKKTGREIGKVVIRVFDAAYNKLVDTGVTDSKGRYAILVGPSTYYITAEKEGFNTYQSTTIDFSSGETNGVGGVISRSFSLEPTNFDEKSGKGV